MENYIITYSIFDRQNNMLKGPFLIQELAISAAHKFSVEFNEVFDVVKTVTFQNGETEIFNPEKHIQPMELIHTKHGEE